jgi:NAD+--asparagine ADP-ribosyltransferase
MTDKEFLKSIQKIIDPATVNNIKKFVIIQEKDGYRVFEKYIIKKTVKGYQVIQLYNDQINAFCTLKYALTWCTLDNKNKIVEADRVKFLDNQLNGLDISINLCERYLKKSKEKDKKFIYLNKIIENKLKQTSVISELSVLGQKAKNYQLNWLNQSSYK